MPTPPKRIIYFIVVATLTFLFTYSFVTELGQFNLLVFDPGKYIIDNHVIVELFTFFLSITGFVSVHYTSQLIKINKPIRNTALIDDSELSKPSFGWKYYVHLQFCGLIILLGLFLLIFPIQEDYPLSRFPEGFSIYLMVVVIIGLGVLLLRDGIQLKREIEPNK